MPDQMRDDLRLAAEIVREEKQFANESIDGRDDAALERTAALLERLADLTRMPAQFKVVTITAPDGAGFDVWVRNLYEDHEAISALIEAAGGGWSGYSTEAEAPAPVMDERYELVVQAAERRANELLNEASGQSEKVARLTIDEHYQPLRDAIDAFRAQTPNDEEQ